MWTLLLYGLVPLIVFVIVDYYSGIKLAIFSAIACALADIFATYFMTGQWDPSTFVAFGLIVALGLLTLKLSNPLYVKLQPVAMAALYAGIVAYFQFFGGGVITKYMPLILKMMPPEMRAGAARPEVMAQMDQAVTGLIFVFLIHGAWVTWAAYKKSNVHWLVVRGLGIWAVFLAYMVLFLLFTIVRTLTA